MSMSFKTMVRSSQNLATFSIVLLFLLSCSSFIPTEAYGRINHNGNITVKWDIINWTPDGYVGLVTIYNFQKNQSIKAPGWKLGWTWAQKEIIWSTIGGQVTKQGDCSLYKNNIPTSCKRNPTIIDLKPDTPYNQQIANCCKGGVLSSWFQDLPNSISSFQLSVGQSGTTTKYVKLPRKFTFEAPGARYVCRPAKIVKRTRFITPDKRRSTRALMTWKVTCFLRGIKPSHK